MERRSGKPPRSVKTFEQTDHVGLPARSTRGVARGSAVFHASPEPVAETHATSARGRGRGRKRGSFRGGGRNRSTAEQSERQAKTSPVKADALMPGVFAVEGVSLYQLTLSDRITSEMLGLLGVIDAVHVKLSSTNTYFSKHVTRSVFSYYFCALAYARVLRLTQLHGGALRVDEISFVEFIDASTLHVPDQLGAYLSAFGRTQLSDGTRLRLRVLTRPSVRGDGIPGFFGRVGPTTHYLYGAYACLAVCAMRICKDVDVCLHRRRASGTYLFSVVT